MKTYIALAWSFFRASLMSDLEYRMNIVVKILTDIVWYAAQLSVFEVLFRHTHQIAGWDLNAMRVFMGMLFVVDGLWMVLFSENLDRMSDRVRKGELDLLLVKPVNAQFILCLQKMNTAYVGNVCLAIGWLVYALSRLPGEFSWGRLFVLLVSVPCSLLITYGIRFFFTCLSLIFTRAEAINYLWYSFYRLGTRPDAIYPRWIRYALLSILPLAFLASVPARLILQSPDWALLAACIAMAVLSVYASTLFWKYAIRFYSSASS